MGNRVALSDSCELSKSFELFLQVVLCYQQGGYRLPRLVLLRGLASCGMRDACTRQIFMNIISPAGLVDLNSAWRSYLSGTMWQGEELEEKLRDQPTMQDTYYSSRFLVYQISFVRHCSCRRLMSHASLAGSSPAMAFEAALTSLVSIPCRQRQNSNIILDTGGELTLEVEGSLD
jgi:hypothetical protein